MNNIAKTSNIGITNRGKGSFSGFVDKRNTNKAITLAVSNINCLSFKFFIRLA